MSSTISFKLPFGDSTLPLRLPTQNLIDVQRADEPAALPNLGEAISAALNTPNGTGPLRDLVEPGNTVSVVVNDITRPVASSKPVPYILDQLMTSGVRPADITIVVATGMHRANTSRELNSMLGAVPVGVNIQNHDGRDKANLVEIGTTSHGIPVEISRYVVESDVRILTGYISPHQQAGFTGGRKSVLPGIASHESIKHFHSFPICPREAVLGKLEGNLTHEESLEAARILGVNFIVNVVTNSQGDIIQVVAGDLASAWMEGVQAWRDKLQSKVSGYADISVVSAGGYPRDINFWQAQKAIAAAELVTKQHGLIILAAQCRDGLGEEDLGWHNWLVEAAEPKQVIERFELEGFVKGSSKAFLFARALQNHQVVVLTENIKPKLLKDMFFIPAKNIQRAFDKALADLGAGARVIVLPNAVDTLPAVMPDCIADK